MQIDNVSYYMAIFDHHDGNLDFDHGIDHTNNFTGHPCPGSILLFLYYSCTTQVTDQIQYTLIIYKYSCILSTLYFVQPSAKITIHLHDFSPRPLWTCQLYFIIPVRNHLLDIVGYVPNNDIIFIKSTQESRYSFHLIYIKRWTQLTENTKCVAKIIFCFFGNVYRCPLYFFFLGKTCLLQPMPYSNWLQLSLAAN